MIYDALNTVHMRVGQYGDEAAHPDWQPPAEAKKRALQQRLPEPGLTRSATTSSRFVSFSISWRPSG